jgi:hypothetical protein
VKVTTRILGLAASAALTIGALGGTLSVASADGGPQLANNTCGAFQSAASPTMIDGIPTIARATEEAFDGVAVTGRVSAEGFDGVATTARVNGEAIDGAAVLTTNEQVGISGAAVAVQSRDGSDCLPLAPRAPEIVK